MSHLALLAANVFGWLTVQVVAGYTAHRLPLSRLQHDGPLRRIRPFEPGLYRRLEVARWKDLLPDAGAFFTGGTSKRELPAGTSRRARLERFAAEARRAEVAHTLPFLALPLFALFNPPAGLAVCVVYVVAFNAPCLVVQRYNRLRCLRVLERPSGSRSPAPRPKPRTSGSNMP
jgi:glycosyl-4,4'-diaponeurosporenoate acyltransferase